MLCCTVTGKEYGECVAQSGVLAVPRIYAANGQLLTPKAVHASCSSRVVCTRSLGHTAAGGQSSPCAVCCLALPALSLRVYHLSLDDLTFRSSKQSGHYVLALPHTCASAGKDESREAYDALISAGLTFIDTAEVYGYGKSEEFLGKPADWHGSSGLAARCRGSGVVRSQREGRSRELKGRRRRQSRGVPCCGCAMVRKAAGKAAGQGLYDGADGSRGGSREGSRAGAVQ